MISGRDGSALPGIYGTLPLRSKAGQSPAAGPPAVDRGGITKGHKVQSVILILVGVLVGTSAFPSLRPDIFGLLLHPYLIPCLFVFFTNRTRVLRRVPKNLRTSVVSFLALWLAASLLDVRGLKELVRFVTSTVAAATVCYMVKSEEDFRKGALGLAIAGLVIASKGGGLDPDTVGLAGINPFGDVGNKNLVSLYTIPCFAFALEALLDRGMSRLRRLIAAACSFALVVVTMQSANRSGWVGIGIVASFAILARLRRRRGFAAGLLWIGVLLATVDRFVPRDLVAYRVEYTREGNSSDEVRKSLASEALSIAIANPFLGVGPTRLCLELSRRVIPEAGSVEPHNMFGYIAGGLGIPALLAFFAIGASVLKAGQSLGTSYPERALMLSGFLLIFAYRGLFTHEILWAPAFSVGFGLLLGLATIPGAARSRSTVGPSPVSRRQAGPFENPRVVSSW